eukprot:COSAG02_NODE_4291_length_5541_cov_2.094267_4_plen_416_part_00
MLPARVVEPEPEPEPEPRLPPARLPPLAGIEQKVGGVLASSVARTANLEELAKKKLSELCKLARAKDVDQYQIDEAMQAADPKKAILSLLNRHRSAAPHAAADAGSTSHTASDECSGPVPGGQRELQVLCSTWNLKGLLPDCSLTPLLPSGYDIYAVATQESCASISKSLVWSSKKAWEEMVSLHLSTTYETVCAETLGATHLIVLAKRSIVKAIGGVSCVRSATLATGMGNVVKNKGGVGICMRIGGTSIAFVSSHFAASQTKVKERNADFKRINEELPLDCNVPTKHGPGTALSDRFDMVFWLGDLNYRIDGNRKVVEKLIKRNAEAALRNNDQLINERNRGNVFQGFREGKIRFAPTYKFDPGTDTYDTSSKQRIPAWTDRILYKTQNDEVRTRLRLCNYDSQASLNCSDHK